MELSVASADRFSFTPGQIDKIVYELLDGQRPRFLREGSRIPHVNEFFSRAIEAIAAIRKVKP